MWVKILIWIFLSQLFFNGFCKSCVDFLQEDNIGVLSANDFNGR
jgi:hypothetical protein